MKPEDIDELERVAAYNHQAAVRAVEKYGEGSEVARLFRHRSDEALDSLGEYFALASGVVSEITNDSA